MKRHLSALIIVISFLAGTVAVAQDTPVDPKVQSQVEGLLGGIEDVPTKADFDKIGPDAVRALEAIATNPKVLATKRGRATSALSFFKNDASHATLVRLLDDGNAPILVRRKAVGALALSQGEAALPKIGTYVDHDNKRLRESAIKAAGRVLSPAANAMLVKRLKVEKAVYLQDILKARIAAFRIKIPEVKTLKAPQ